MSLRCSCMHIPQVPVGAFWKPKFEFRGIITWCVKSEWTYPNQWTPLRKKVPREARTVSYLVSWRHHQHLNAYLMQKKNKKKTHTTHKGTTRGRTQNVSMTTIWAFSTWPRMIVSHFKPGQKLFWVTQNRFLKFAICVFFCYNCFLNSSILLKLQGKKRTQKTIPTFTSINSRSLLKGCAFFF